uniref:LRRCT domain-containing protein n=1 Tax=Branchiostoma floridae TaxID=7739 RepID=C3YSN8_BRAFL|eukprot:XP_002600727.1 hypothetical protein BRAFLDRAFT_83469 [Branchiostoma floridae]
MASPTLLLFVSIASLSATCTCLPTECTIDGSVSWASVRCNRLNLAALPGDIPKNVEHLSVAYNHISNVSYLPSLPVLLRLDLTWNSMRVLSWLSLRAVPKLRTLELQSNQLQVVELDTVIEYLPELIFVNLAYNKIVSFSEHQLGVPRARVGEYKAVVHGNPLRCDCDLCWLAVKMACLRGCGKRDQGACCSTCNACFLTSNLKRYFLCHGPSRLQRLSLLSEPTLTLMDCGSRKPTAGTVTIATVSTTVAANAAMTEPHMYSTQYALNRAQSWRESSTDNSNKINNSATAKTNSSHPDSNDEKIGEGQPPSVPYIVAAVVGSLVNFTFIACLVRLEIKYQVCYKRREDVNHHSEANTVSHGEHLAVAEDAATADKTSGHQDEQIAPYAITYDVEDDEITPYAEGHPRDDDGSLCDASDVNVGGDQGKLREGSSSAYDNSLVLGDVSIPGMYGKEDTKETILNG